MRRSVFICTLQYSAPQNKYRYFIRNRKLSKRANSTTKKENFFVEKLKGLNNSEIKEIENKIDFLKLKKKIEPIDPQKVQSTEPEKV